MKPTFSRRFPVRFPASSRQTPVFSTFSRQFSAMLLCIMVTGCAGLADPPTEIRIPVPVPCLSAADVPKPPAFVTDAALSVMTDGDLILSLAADRRQNQGYRAELEAVIQGCVN